MSTEAEIAEKQTLDALYQIKDQLRQAQDIGAPIKQDLFSHLTEVFSRILLHHPYDGYDKFEEISEFVKQTRLMVADPKFDHEVNKMTKEVSVSNKEALAFIEKAKKLIKEKPDVGFKCSDKPLLSKEKQFEIPNLQEEADMLEWAGINFGEDIIYLLQKSLKRLGIMSGASSLSFFGKIYGTQKDYWVVQGTLDFQEEAVRNSQ